MGPTTLGGLWREGQLVWTGPGGVGVSPVLLPITGPLGLVGLDAADVVGGAPLQRGYQVVGLFLREWGESGGGEHRWDPLAPLSSHPEYKRQDTLAGCVAPHGPRAQVSPVHSICDSVSTYRMGLISCVYLALKPKTRSSHVCHIHHLAWHIRSAQ